MKFEGSYYTLWKIDDVCFGYWLDSECSDVYSHITNTIASFMWQPVETKEAVEDTIFVLNNASDTKTVEAFVKGMASHYGVVVDEEAARKHIRRVKDKRRCYDRLGTPFCDRCYQVAVKVDDNGNVVKYYKDQELLPF